ncbi:MAG: hypothetical protein BGP12_11520 [Rhodospirillales bacterium 70-18]|nr:YcaO-like family protein [Rhodospirillales bacterium]OJY68424.1 MAG: hypothetical protein BGP12_11520 [Rhodospirillales bacterium 70-18]
MLAVHPTRGDERKVWTAGTHRGVSPAETLARLLPLAPAFGVSRVANVTGLDHVGIPVVMAVRPNSRSLSVHQGKGATLEAAKASALMEALEWSAAEAPVGERAWVAVAAAGPAAIALPDHLWRGLARPDGAIPWLAGHDILADRPCLVPEELVTTDFTLSRQLEFGWLRATSNGLGAGNTMAEAVLHALCELVERDAFALWRQAPAAAQAATRIDPAAMPDETVAGLLSRLDAAAISVEAWDVTSDLAIPCFHVIIDDRRARPPFLGRFGGVGCHPNAGVALCRALAEAAQSRLTLIAGARDDIPREAYALVGRHRSLASMIVPEAGPPPAGVAWHRAASFDTPHIDADLHATLARLAQHSIARIVAVDLTRPDIGVPCVRMIAPDLEGMAHKPGYRPGPRVRAALRRWS